MAKRQREMEKKRKADDKRSRRKNKDKTSSPIIIHDPQADVALEDLPRAGE